LAKTFLPDPVGELAFLLLLHSELAILPARLRRARQLFQGLRASPRTPPARETAVSKHCENDPESQGITLYT